MPDETDQRDIITPLQNLLIKLPLDDLFYQLHKLKVGFTLRRPNTKQGYLIELRANGTVTYGATGTSVKSAVANALAKFFTGEKRDFHTYQSRS